MTWAAGGTLLEHLDCVGEGWHQILRDMHGELTALDPSYQVSQVKEKFGGLRAYLTIDPDTYKETSVIIRKYEALSYKTCEVCGEPGTPSEPGQGWIKTECPAHKADRPQRIAAFWKQRTEETRSDLPAVGND